jgi:gluconokinase
VEGLEAHQIYEFRTTADGGVEVNADMLLDLVVNTVDEVLHRTGKLSAKIAAVAVSTFWHNLLGVDSQNRAITPVYSWADTRSASAAEELRQRLDENELHARTGCVLHPSYLPAKLFWLHQSLPEVFRGAARWMSFGEYFYLKVFGRTVCSLSMASGTGLLDQNRCEWDSELLQVLPIRVDQLSPLGDLDSPLTELTPPYSRRWPSLSRVPWLPALGDGACSNVGSGCCTRERLAIMVGTSGAMRVLWKAREVKIPQGLWCYRADRRRFVMGGALSNGGLLYEWMNQTLRLDEDPEVIERQLSQMEPDKHGLTVLPFLAGERSTGWNPNARAAIVGLSLHHRPIDVLRASLESVAYRFAKIANLLTQVVPGAREIVASGGALLKSPTWTQMMADVLGQPVVASQATEASSRGAALLALETLGAVRSIEEAPALLGEKFLPQIERYRRYREAMKRQDELYDLLIKPKS